MKHHIRVTIGMCLKNSATTVAEALKSVIDQDFPHELMELIIVDGSSRDNTLAVVKDFLNKTKLHSRIFCENKGLGQARQIVVENAEGQYIIWVDGDMLLTRNFVKNQVEFMDRNPEIGIAKGRYELSSGPNLLATLEIYSRAAAKLVDYSQKKAVSKSLGTSGCIYRVKAIRQVGGFDENIKGYGEDLDAEYRTRAAGWSLCVIQVLYRDYERLGLTWKKLWVTYWKRGFDMIDVIRKHNGIIKLHWMLPPVALIAGLFNSLRLYKLIQEKVVFLLPLQHALKMIPWWFGFIRRRLDLKMKRIA